MVADAGNATREDVPLTTDVKSDGVFRRILLRLGLVPSRKSAEVHAEDWFELERTLREDDVRLLYEKTFAILTTFLDWRHKSMTLGFAVLAAAVTLDEWLLVHEPDFHWALAAPLFVAAAFCIVVRAFDARNQQILNDAYHAGERLEKELGASSGAMMTRIPVKRPLWTYHETIKVVFAWSAVVCLAAAVGSIIWSVAS